EGGIRGFHVTGVQTCALPIWGFSWPKLSSRAVPTDAASSVAADSGRNSDTSSFVSTSSALAATGEGDDTTGSDGRGAAGACGLAGALVAIPDDAGAASGEDSGCGAGSAGVRATMTVSDVSEERPVALVFVSATTGAFVPTGSDAVAGGVPAAAGDSTGAAMSLCAAFSAVAVPRAVDAEAD